MKLFTVLLSLVVIPPAQADESRADFELPDVAGKTVRIAELRGKPVVLNFWAFWCDTWKDEMPHLRELSGQQKDRGFHLVAVSVDGTRVDQFKKHEPNGVPFTVLLDNSKKVSQSYRIAHVPTVIILDTEGHERYRHVGFPGNHVILRELRQLPRRPAGVTDPNANSLE